MKKITILSFLVPWAGLVVAQEVNEITLTRFGLFGPVFEVRGEDAARYNPGMPMNSVLDIMRRYDEAHKYFKKGRAQFIVGSLLGATGGFLMGYQLGAHLGGGSADWTVFGVGAGVAAFSIPFSVDSTINLKQAISIYNAGGKLSAGKKPILKFAMAMPGAHIQFVF